MATKTKQKTIRSTSASSGVKVREHSVFVENAAYLTLKDGKTEYTELTGAANEVLPTGYLDKVRITRNVEEFKGSGDSGVAYRKTMWSEQTRDSTGSRTEAQSTGSDPAMPDGEVRPGMDKADYLKNFFDNLAVDVRQHKNWIIGTAVVAAIALLFAVYGALN